MEIPSPVKQFSYKFNKAETGKSHYKETNSNLKHLKAREAAMY